MNILVDPAVTIGCLTKIGRCCCPDAGTEADALSGGSASPPRPRPPRRPHLRMRVPVPGQIRDGEFADTSRELITRDGWKVTVSKFGEKLDSVPPLNRSPQSFEGFSSVGGEAKIEAAYPNDPKQAQQQDQVRNAHHRYTNRLRREPPTASPLVDHCRTRRPPRSPPTVTASGTVTGQGQGAPTVAPAAAASPAPEPAACSPSLSDT